MFHSVEVHRLLTLDDLNLVSVLFKDLHAVFPVLISIRLGKHLEVVSPDIALVLDATALDDADIAV